MTEPATLTIRVYNRRRINTAYDKFIANELRWLRADLMIAEMDPVSRTNTVAITHEVLKNARKDALLEGDLLAEKGHKIKSIEIVGNKLVVTRSECVRSTTFSGTSENAQVGGEALSENAK